MNMDKIISFFKFKCTCMPQGGVEQPVTQETGFVLLPEAAKDLENINAMAGEPMEHIEVCILQLHNMVYFKFGAIWFHSLLTLYRKLSNV